MARGARGARLASCGAMSIHRLITFLSCAMLALLVACGGAAKPSPVPVTAITAELAAPPAGDDTCDPAGDRVALAPTGEDALDTATAATCKPRFVCSNDGFRYVTRPQCNAACDGGVCEQACCYTAGVCIYP